MAKIDKIEGIGSKHAKKLKNFGIRTTDRLLLVAAHKRGREDLAEQIKIPEDLILDWVHTADLIRIRGIGEEYSNLLEQVGVETLDKLSQSQAKKLYKSLADTNREKMLVRRTPARRDVENWVKQAKRVKSVVKF